MLYRQRWRAASASGGVTIFKRNSRVITGMRAVFLAAVAAAGVAAWSVALAVGPFALAAPHAEGLLVVVVRHAEKASDNPRDPGLSPLGKQRAEMLARRLSGLPLAAAYATPFKRTQRTARAVAEQQGIAVTLREFVSRNADEDAQALRQMILNQHRGEAVLVVGHSNTVPAIVEALSGIEAEPMPETEYDRLSVVRIDADGSAQLQVERY